MKVKKIFAKERHCRHFIEITGVRCERLQDITWQDCIKEGGSFLQPTRRDFRFDGQERTYPTPQESYAAIIDKLHGSGTWERNPYVFRYEFKLLK